MRQKIIIPGDRKEVSITGKSLVVEKAPVYQDVENAPQFKFKPGDFEYTIYPESTYENSQGNFNRIVIFGNPVAQNDEIIVLAVDACLGTDIDVQSASQTIIEPSKLKSLTLNGGQQSFTNNQKYKDNELARSVDVYVTGGDALVAYGGSSPEQPDTGHRMKAGEHYKINGQGRIDTAKFINADSGVKSVLQLTFDH